MSFSAPFTDPSTLVIVTKEEFLSFYNIDRQLFTRLVVGLGRGTSQSTHVMAFIIWLEKQCKDMNLMKNMLQWPDTTLASLVDEVILVINCIESPQFIYDDVVNHNALPVVKSILQNNDTSLKYFYGKRLIIISAVTKILNNICLKVFIDIVQQVQYTKAMKERVYYNPLPGFTIVPEQVVLPTPQRSEGSSCYWDGSNPPLETYDVSNQKEEVPVDDRIIFITFSEGYPTSKAEIRDFFSRRYGNIIEALLMQDVAPPDQPVYACVVIRAEAIHMIEHFLESTKSVRLYINGKHAWATKYVPK
uniref:RRM domain-containing protein n=1 Tax=Cajanus cajan TaxID=3821 RepID=A0A151SFN3_CAJCA|nr:hypothetical protein KK1_024535 [Cajanus cajan]